MWEIYLPAIQESATLWTIEALNWVVVNLKQSQLEAHIYNHTTKTVLRINYKKGAYYEI